MTFASLQPGDKIFVCTAGLGKVKRRLKKVSAVGPRQIEVDGRAYEKDTGRLFGAPASTIFLALIENPAVPDDLKDEVNRVEDDMDPMIQDHRDGFHVDRNEGCELCDETPAPVRRTAPAGPPVNDGQMCWCGCGQIHAKGKRFRSGHDAKLKGYLIHWQRTNDAGTIPPVVFDNLQYIFDGRFTKQEA